MAYLNEDNLDVILKELYPNVLFIRNKQIPNFKHKWRPDFRSDELMLLIEFDGYLHYTKNNTILIDKLKDIEYTKLGYNVIRIPYFIQLNTEVIKLLFNIDYEFNQVYSHGFIDDKAIRPYDFCYNGLIRYKKDIIKFDICKNDIDKSLGFELDQVNIILNSINI